MRYSRSHRLNRLLTANGVSCAGCVVYERTRSETRSAAWLSPLSSPLLRPAARKSPPDGRVPGREAARAEASARNSWRKARGKNRLIGCRARALPLRLSFAFLHPAPAGFVLPGRDEAVSTDQGDRQAPKTGVGGRERADVLPPGALVRPAVVGLRSIRPNRIPFRQGGEQRGTVFGLPIDRWSRAPGSG